MTTPDNPLVNKHTVLAELQKHIGRANGIKSEALAATLHVSKRDVRFYITELRLDGVAVCGQPATGYFIAENQQEIEDTYEFLFSRAMHSLTLAGRLKNVAIADMLQMKLKT